MDNSSMDAYDKAQQMIVEGVQRDDVEMFLVKNFPDLNAQGLVPTILRRAYKDLAEL
jgi:hypothetical protein